MPDIRDIKGLVPVPASAWWAWLLLALAGAAGMVAWRLWKRRKPAGTGETPGQRSAFDIALAALQRLRDDHPPVDPFYTRLSDIVRQYLEGEFQLRAPERTTEEFLRDVSLDRTLTREHQELLGAFLQEADLVKFARHQPDPADRQRAFAAADRFVRESHERSEPTAGRAADPSNRPDPIPPEAAVAP